MRTSRPHRTPRRHLDFFALQEALGQPGCPACRLADGAGARWLQTLLYEQVNDPVVRARLRAAGGLCREHTAALVRLGDALGSSILYADLLAEAGKSWRGGAPERCPACQAGEEAGRRALGALISHMVEDSVRTAYRDSDGLCLKHLGQLRDARNGPAVTALVEIERERLQRLTDECAEFVAKSDYRRQGEALGPERNAWQRAARKVGGGFPRDGAQ